MEEENEEEKVKRAATPVVSNQWPKITMISSRPS